MNRPASRITRTTLLSFLVGLPLFACGGGGGNGGGSRVAGASMSAMAQPACAHGDTLRYAAAALDSLGTATTRVDLRSTGSKAAPLGYVTAVSPLGATGVAAADAMARDVVVFDSTGVVRARFGRRGSGPGEFRSVTALAAEGDTLVAVDPVASRLTYFDTAGAVLGTAALPSLPQLGQIPRFGIFRGGVMATGYRGFQASLMAALGGQRSAATRGTVELIAWHTGDSTWTVLRRVPSAEFYVSMRGERQGGMQSVPYSPRPLWSVSSDGGFWYADAARFSLERRRRTGTRACTVRVALPAVAVSDSERAAYYAAAGPGIPAAMRRRVRQMRKSVPVPSRKPALRALLATDGDGVWVQASAAGDAPGAVARRWYRFGADGHPRLPVLLPAGFRPTAVRGDRVYGVATDSLDVQSVEVLEVGG